MHIKRLVAEPSIAGADPGFAEGGLARCRASGLISVQSALSRGVWGHAPSGKFWDF